MERVHECSIQRRVGAQSHVTQGDPEYKGVRSQDERTMFKSEKGGHRDDCQILLHMLAQPAQQEATKEHLFEDRHQETPTNNCNDPNGRRLTLQAACVRRERDDLSRNAGYAAEDRSEAVVEEDNDGNSDDEYANACDECFCAGIAERNWAVGSRFEE